MSAKAKANTLQAMLNRVAPEPAPEPMPAPEAKAPSPVRAPPPARKAASVRTATKLIGGHFAPEISTQLRIIAAEEGTTVQALLGEALDDLFTKKGKGRVGR